MRNIIIVFLAYILSTNIVLAQKEQVFFNDGIVFIKNYKANFKDTLIGGKSYSFPANWSMVKGTNNDIVFYPENWIVKEGSDGHPIAFPPTWGTLQGFDGRLIAFPYEEKINSIERKKEGCIVSDIDDCIITIVKKTNKFGLYTQIGDDGRRIIYSKDMKIAQSPDGRLINLPKGWEISQSSKGRYNAYPKNWDVFIMEDEKEIAMPKNWNIDVDKNRPKTVFGFNFIKFIYNPIQQIDLAKNIYNQDKQNGLNYLLYLLVNDFD